MWTRPMLSGKWKPERVSAKDPMTRRVFGMVGGGQLARMTHQAAIGLDVEFVVLAESPDDPVAQVDLDIKPLKHRFQSASIALSQVFDFY